MPKLITASLVTLTVGYFACLGGALLESAGAFAAPPSFGPRRYVLRPVAGATTVETRAPGVHLRRTCGDGRCELLAGRGQGFELLASYPADEWVVVEDDLGVRVRDIGDVPAVLGPRAALSPGWPAALAMALALLVAILALHHVLGRELRRLRRARPARADADGTLHFLDDALPRVAHAAEPTPIGPVSALHAMCCACAGGAFRERAVETWAVRPGALTDRIARVAGARAAVATLAWVVLGTAAAGGLLVLALV